MCVLHNFLIDHDPTDIDHYLAGDDENQRDPNPGTLPHEETDFGTLAMTAVTAVEKARATANRDRIAQALWDDYQRILQERGV